ncbi:hypothetical protein SCUCBS95973_000902 [Sporothrix curviconia]|uniref:Uncharacterized protein n=1 Tax=Sporothrix curviconia TaxID=1260050 RepID=A0ABP0AU51_9PEZI
MAKTRPGSSKKGRSKNKKSSHNAASDGASGRPSKSPKALVQDAEAAMTQGDVGVALAAAQKARKALENASSGNGSNNIVVDGVGLAAVCALVGEIYLENGDVAEARAALERSVRLDPEGTLPEALGGGVDKFLYLAQLSEEGGRDSLQWFERGAGALRTLAGRLEKEAKGAKGARRKSADKIDMDEDGGEDEDEDDENSELSTIHGKLAQILCAMAEVWMTDLSFEDDCEQQCEALTTEATIIDPSSTEAWQTLASVRISQSRDEEARAALQRSIALWEDLHPLHPLVPAFSVRVSLARMLMTVGWLAKAIEVTTNLLREDEQSVEVWYLAGYANHLLGQQLKEAEATDPKQKKDLWKGPWLEARRCLGRCLRRFAQQQYEDERLGEHANELFRELETAVGPAPQKEKDEEDYEEEDEDEEWEDEDDDEDGEEADEDEDEEMED